MTFERASAAFGDPLAILMTEPDHSEDEERYVLTPKSAGREFCRTSTPDTRENLFWKSPLNSVPSPMTLLQHLEKTRFPSA